MGSHQKLVVQGNFYLRVEILRNTRQESLECFIFCQVDPPLHTGWETLVQTKCRMRHSSDSRIMDSCQEMRIQRNIGKEAHSLELGVLSITSQANLLSLGYMLNGLFNKKFHEEWVLHSLFLPENANLARYLQKTLQGERVKPSFKTVRRYFTGFLVCCFRTSFYAIFSDHTFVNKLRTVSVEIILI